MSEIIDRQLALDLINRAERDASNDLQLALASCQLAITLANLDKFSGIREPDNSGASSSLLEERLKTSDDKEIDLKRLLSPREQRLLDVAKVFVGLTYGSAVDESRFQSKGLIK